jgi:transcriptional antiterminator RfaH
MVSNSPLAWYAIRTKPSQEQRASDNLTAWNVETLVPWLSTSKKTLALFPGYIFAHFSESIVHKVNHTRGIVGVVSFGRRPAVIEDDLIVAIRNRIDGQGKVQTGTTSFQPGDPVLIQSGPLKNFMGVFQRYISGSERVQILLTSVSYLAHVQIESASLSKRNPASVPLSLFGPLRVH